jgi:glycine/D-amino acid oxidase-like deaminating enzyme
LARTGRRVILCDQKAGPGYGSSSASSGIIRFEYTLATSVIVAWEASHDWANLRDYLAAPATEPLAQFHRCGKIMIDCPAFPRDLLQNYFESIGIEYEYWDAAELPKRIGGLDPGRHYPPKPIDAPEFWDDPTGQLGAIYTPQAGFIDDPRLACENFADAAVRAGAEVRYRAPVVGLARAGDGYQADYRAGRAGQASPTGWADQVGPNGRVGNTGLSGDTGLPGHRGPAGDTRLSGQPELPGRTNPGDGIGQIASGVWQVLLSSGELLEAPLVVNAAGPWSPEINRLAGAGGEFSITTRPLRQEVHSVPAPAGFNPPDGLGPAVADQDLGYYLRPEPSGGLLIGGTEPDCDALDWVEGPVDAVNMNRTAELFEKQVTRAARRFPGLAIPPRPAGVVGVYDVATDWTPIYDKTDLPGFFVAIGTSGNQFKNGPLIGEFISALIEADGRGQDHDVVPVRYTGRVTGRQIDLSLYSRLRQPAANSGTVAG